MLNTIKIYTMTLFIALTAATTLYATQAVALPSSESESKAAAIQTSEAEVKAAYEAWCASIAKAKGDPKEITQYYAPEGILLPTLSHEILSNKENGLDPYFTKLTSLPDIKCVQKKLITRVHGDTAINTGLYDFTYTDEDKTETVPARFTFVYKKFGNKWLIIKHHSSQMPVED